jgi:hypothetical protein
MESKMGVEAKTRTGQDSFLDALRCEVVAGTEILSAWVTHVQAKERIELLLEFETWLRGLCAFLECRHVPLSEADRSALVTRNFAPEIAVVRMALQECMRCAVELVSLGQDARVEFEALVETQIFNAGALDSQVGKMLEQSTPIDSFSRLIESMNDLTVTIDALENVPNQDLQLYLSIGRSFQRDLQNCRYVDMLLSQRFRLQHDRMENAVLSAVLRSITEEHLRRNVALTLLYLYRFLKYLKCISTALRADLPLRRYLVVFSLLHQQTEILRDFLKARFLKERRGNAELRNAMELIFHSLQIESERVFTEKLINVAAERDASTLYSRVEDCHGMLRNCYQQCAITVIQAFDRAVDGKALFPSMRSSLQNSQKIQKDLWDLRQDLKADLEKAQSFDLDHILGRISQFQESSMEYLMFKDWGAFETFSESLINAGSQAEARILVQKFIDFLSILNQEVSKRGVLNPPVKPPESP